MSKAKSDHCVLVEHGEHYDFVDAGFDDPNVDAEVVIVGITPGATQIKQEGEESDRKRRYAFSGRGMRTRLYQMLEHIGLKKLIGDFDEKTLWESPEFFDRIDPTSLLKRGVFRRKEGASVVSRKENVLASSLVHGFNNPQKIKGDKELESELESFKKDLEKYRKVRLFIALGSRVRSCLDELIRGDQKYADVPIVEIPHPSGTNASRVKEFLVSSDCDPCEISCSGSGQDGKIRCNFKLAKESRAKVMKVVEAMHQVAQ